MERLLPALLQPSAYPEPTEQVHLLQTHVSFLFITDSFVYKIKKSVDLGFLNFLSIENRRFFCEEEVRLNRRLCPDMYLGVVELKDTVQGLSFYGEGETIDYAVKMKRLPEERMLNKLLDENLVLPEDIRLIAATIGRFHLEADKGEEIASYGTPAMIRANWEENFQQCCPYINVTISKTDFSLIRQCVEKFMMKHAEVFAERIADGYIKDCDGDIHSGNICLVDEKVYIFDCIEFNKRFRFIDTAADCAFFLMDLEFHRKPHFAREFLDEYRRITGDFGMERVLDFYKVYRAFIRGKVESFRINDQNIPIHEKESAEQRAAAYFRLARGYIVRQNLPISLIIFCGLMGSGKSTIASDLAFELGLNIMSSDVIRKEREGLSPFIHRFNDYDKGIYTPAKKEATYDHLLQQADKVLASQQSIIIDASFTRQKERERFKELARSHGVSFVIIETTCCEQESRTRLLHRLQKTDEPSDGRWEIFHRQKAEYQAPAPEEGRLLSIDTSTLTSTAESINKILSFLEVLPSCSPN